LIEIASSLIEIAIAFSTNEFPFAYFSHLVLKLTSMCLRLLATLRLDPARSQLISGFVDTYLTLNETEAQMFQTEIGKLEETEREGVMAIVTSWMQQGIE
jgi:hypothetical protein